MNRRKFIKLLAALPFAGALWRNLVDEAEAAVITVDDIIDTRPPLYTIAMGDGGSSPPAEVVYYDLCVALEDIEAGMILMQDLETFGIYPADTGPRTPIIGIAARDIKRGESVALPVYPDVATEDVIVSGIAWAKMGDASQGVYTITSSGSRNISHFVKDEKPVKMIWA